MTRTAVPSTALHRAAFPTCVSNALLVHWRCAIGTARLTTRLMNIDQVVQIALLVGLTAVGIDHWRRGQRGWRLAALVFISFYGVGLVATMSAHCADIIHNLVLRNRSVVDGSPFAYNWRTYSLLLFGVLLIDRGIRCLRAARRFAAGDFAARTDILKSSGLVLAITLPIIPIHAFFGVLISAWSSLALIVTAAGLRARQVESSRFPADAVRA